MSEYEALRTEIERMGTSYVAYASAVDRYAEVVNEQVAALWADNAELRDELHAVANRVETLTRARLTEPAEVAERMTRNGERPALLAGEACPTCYTTVQAPMHSCPTIRENYRVNP